MGDGRRDMRYDAVKGLAIILMVIGHAGVCDPILRFIYLFHVPVFFIVAGWFYRTPTDWQGVLRFGWRRILRIWWPFVFWASVVVLLHDVFVGIGLFGSHEHCYYPAYERWGLLDLWGIRATFYHWLQVFMMKDGMVGLGAAYWFLPVFFYASVVYVVIDFAMSKIHRIPRLVLITIALLTLVVLARYTDVKFMKSIAKRIGGRNSITALYLFNLGVILRCFDWRIDRLSRWGQVVVASVCLIGLMCLMPLGTLGLVDNLFPSVRFLTLSSLLGWGMLCAIGGVSGPVQGALAFVGRRTLPILLLHLFVFKAVSAAGIALTGESWTLLGRHVISFGGFWWCLLYVAAGVILPMALNDAWWSLYARAKKLIGAA